MDNRDCIFCKIASGEISSQIEHQDQEILAFRDINPQAPVHLLIIPRRHIPRLSDLTEEDRELMGKMVLVATDLARQHRLDERGYRLVVNCGREAGQGVFHLHLHLLGGRTMHWPPG